MIRHVALVSESQAVSASVAASIAAAVQKQVTRDFSPLWQVDATLSYFAALNDVPIGYWPIIIVDQLSDPNAGGFHTGNRMHWCFRRDRYQWMSAMNVWKCSPIHLAAAPMPATR
jgi:hypothetical protein